MGSVTRQDHNRKKEIASKAMEPPTTVKVEKVLGNPQFKAEQIVFHKTATLKTGSLKEATNSKQPYLNSNKKP